MYGDEKITEMERIASLEKTVRDLLKRISDLESEVEAQLVSIVELQNP